MINIKELEKRWYRYKAKGLIFVFSILAILVTLIYGGYYILYKLDLNISFGEQNTSTTVIDTKIVKESNSTEDNKIIVEEKKESEDVLLAPTIPIVDLEHEKTKDKRRVVNKQRVKKRKKLVKAKTATYLTAKELAVVNNSPKKINLHLTSSNYMSIMKKKFEQNKNPREALLIANAYYKAGNYKNSEKWALKANNLDKSLDESWIIFASSQEKLGKREEALKILVAYYRTSKSVKAKALIDKIKAKSI
ncbi:Transformation system protein [hydrothermal vent metagenome]|uniref:Transformation system protein n=1 Tax=hydrothermal vent metagenome TaxID=652676 RepID=A0A1W1CNV2_9ZZZZ